MKLSIPSIFSAFQLLFFGLVISLNSCSTPEKDPSYFPDLAPIKEDITIHRFEQDFFQLQPNALYTGIQTLRQKYPEFTDNYLRGTLNSPMDSANMVRHIRGYLNFQPTQMTLDSIRSRYPNIDSWQSELNALANHYNYYLQNSSTPFPKVYTYLSEYATMISLSDEVLGLALDMTLGENYPAYLATNPPMPLFQRRVLRPEYLISQASFALANRFVEQKTKRAKNKLVDYMIFEGKKYFLADLLLPQSHDSLIFGVSSLQAAYCRKGERGLYQHLAEEELLYSSSYRDFKKYVTRGPFDPQLDLPGNSGSWLGTQFVRQHFMFLRKAMRSSQPNAPQRSIDQMALMKTIEELDSKAFLKTYKAPKQ